MVILHGLFIRKIDNVTALPCMWAVGNESKHAVKGFLQINLPRLQQNNSIWAESLCICKPIYREKTRRCSRLCVLSSKDESEKIRSTI